MAGSFSAVSKRNFERKYAFDSIFQALQDSHTFAPLQSQHFTKNRTQKFQVARHLRVLQSSKKLSRETRAKRKRRVPLDLGYAQIWLVLQMPQRGSAKVVPQRTRSYGFQKVAGRLIVQNITATQSPSRKSLKNMRPPTPHLSLKPLPLAAANPLALAHPAEARAPTTGAMRGRREGKGSVGAENPQPRLRTRRKQPSLATTQSRSKNNLFSTSLMLTSSADCTFQLSKRFRANF